MNTQHTLISPAGHVNSECQPAVQRAEWNFRNGDVTADIVAARARLIAAAERYRRRKALSGNGAYYGDKKAQLEEVTGGLSRTGIFVGIVTRNHYGCLVLNTHRGLFIDVDMPDHGDRLEGQWQRTFEDLCAVLSSERNEGFRIYRTAAGFRILATGHEFEPGSMPTRQLMDAVGADADFVKLCQTQRTFRARLTPKPWRCGVSQPPNSFPRKSVENQRRFGEWLERYENACQDRATCQYLVHIGPTSHHRWIAPVVDFHDRETKAFASLPLA